MGFYLPLGHERKVEVLSTGHFVAYLIVALAVFNAIRATTGDSIPISCLASPGRTKVLFPQLTQPELARARS